MSVAKKPINQSFNEDFCLHLEYHLSTAFQNSGGKKTKRFWCHGVIAPVLDNEVAIQRVITKGKVETEGWMGFTGQDRYRVIIKLGEVALSKFIQGLSLIDCLPGD